MKRFNESMNNAIQFITSSQENDGHFPSYSSLNAHDFSHAVRHESLFPTAMILNSLASCPDASLDDIKKKGIDFLLSQHSALWTWNYWIRNSEDATTHPYPDDLDDTALSLSAIHRIDSTFIDGGVMAHIVEALTLLEKKEGGPYRTWIVGTKAPKAFRDIDIAVNCNIAYLLTLFEIELPPLQRFIKNIIRTKAYTSPYYFGEFPVLYFLSRWYQGKEKNQIQEHILSHRCDDGSFEHRVLSTATAVTSLFHLSSTESDTKIDRTIEQSIEYLLSQQRNDGGWDAHGFVVEMKEGNDVWYAGSDALTTALCLEALSLFYTLERKEKRKEKDTEEKVGEHLAQKVVQRVKSRFDVLGEPLRREAHDALARVLGSDTSHMIVLLPYVFLQSLETSLHKKISGDELCILLGCANLYGWIAYTIYDDFLDDEGVPKDLSVANVSLREMTRIFESISSHGFDRFYSSIIDRIDRANTWEVMNARREKMQDIRFKTKEMGRKSKVESIKSKVGSRKYQVESRKYVEGGIPEFGDLSQLSEKSLGHGLGPMAILFALGYDETSEEMIQLERFFHHYLIARQLNDDAHDWEEDLKKGQINAVGAMILRVESIKSKAGSRKSKVSSRKYLVESRESKVESRKYVDERMKVVFWERVIPDVVGLIHHHTKEAMDALKHITVLQDRTVFERVLRKLDAAADLALSERKKTMEFLEEYSK